MARPDDPDLAIDDIEGRDIQFHCQNIYRHLNRNEERTKAFLDLATEQYAQSTVFTLVPAAAASRATRPPTATQIANQFNDDRNATTSPALMQACGAFMFTGPLDSTHINDPSAPIQLPRLYRLSASTAQKQLAVAEKFEACVLASATFELPGLLVNDDEIFLAGLAQDIIRNDVDISRRELMVDAEIQARIAGGETAQQARRALLAGYWRLQKDAVMKEEGYTFRGAYKVEYLASKHNIAHNDINSFFSLILGINVYQAQQSLDIQTYGPFVDFSDAESVFSTRFEGYQRVGQRGVQHHDVDLLRFLELYVFFSQWKSLFVKTTSAKLQQGNISPAYELSSLFDFYIVKNVLDIMRSTRDHPQPGNSRSYLELQAITQHKAPLNDLVDSCCLDLVESINKLPPTDILPSYILDHHEAQHRRHGSLRRVYMDDSSTSYWMGISTGRDQH